MPYGPMKPNKDPKYLMYQALLDDYEHLKQKSKAAVDVVRWAKAVLSSNERGGGVLYAEAMEGMYLAIQAFNEGEAREKHGERIETRKKMNIPWEK